MNRSTNLASEAARHWSLDPEIVFLNHGSFGACPAAVLEKQTELRRLLEREPVVFLDREYYGRLDAARAALASFVGARPEDLAFVSNATSGVNAVLRSLRFKPGDELLVTDQAYNACKNALHYAAVRDGANVVVAALPFPVAGAEEIIDAVLAKVTGRTRLALIDHITSPTALVLPVATLVRELAARGVETLVDGAHAPGMTPLDLQVLGAAYYTGNCHKWLCAPKGAAFLHARADRQAGLHPPVISHGYNAPEGDDERFRVEFDWTGTADPTAYLCIPEAIRLLETMLPGGWPELMKHNHRLAVAGRRILCDAWQIPAPCPEEMLGSMAALPLPDSREEISADFRRLPPLQEKLFARYRIEIPVIPWPAPPRRLIRISAQLYNSEAQYRYLAEAVRELLREEAALI